MKILFIHQNFPGQFGHLAERLARDPAHEVVALAMRAGPTPPGVRLRRYGLLRPPVSETHPLLRDTESKALRGEACAAAALQLGREGFVPDVIVAHPGWGEAMFVKDALPRARLVVYCEYHYASEGQDVGFDPEVPPFDFAQRARLRLRNVANLLALEAADAALSPTVWQRSTYPAWARDRITVIHDGIDFRRLGHDRKASIPLPAHGGLPARALSAGDEVLTYVARNLEPIRGFHMLMRCLPEVLRRRPHAHVVVAGGDERGYGHAPPPGRTWRESLLDEVGDAFDTRRVHFVGRVPYATYLGILGASRAHAYWTTPFVLSWSFLEAACSGLPVIASDTPPVREFSDALGVRTAGFFDRAAFTDALVETLARKPAPRRPVELPQVELERCVAAQARLVLQLA